MKQRTDGVTAEAIEDALYQKLAQKELIFIADGSHQVGERSSPGAPAFIRVESQRILRFEIQEIQEIPEGTG
jgi:hypothetical protein